MQRYTRVAIGLHWVIAATIFGTFALGVYMHELPLSPTKLRLYSYHKWIGVTIFTLVLFRLLWRLGHRPPPPPLSMSEWQRRAAMATHAMLYALTLAIPVSGWLMSSASGFQVVYLGVLPIPDLVGRDKALADQLKDAHEFLNMFMLALVVLHVAAALKHHLLDRDDVLARIFPLVKSRSKSA